MTKTAFSSDFFAPNDHSFGQQAIARTHAGMLIHASNQRDFSNASAPFASVLPNGAVTDAKLENAGRAMVFGIEISK
jgi:hypothetical protein